MSGRTGALRHVLNAAAIAAAFSVSAVSVVPSVLAAQAVAPERGAAALGSTLAGLGTTGRVLTIAAHPDDEDTPLIAWLTRGQHVETAYLSLTRGDGGQNLIGNELGEALGIIRTQELLSARRIDGARQYFTRAYDFGFSKNAEETLQHWPKDTILGDVVRVVRAFRPQVMVAFFSGTPRDGHGHHQVSGQLAREAFDAAADTVRFPVAGYGLPWTPLKFYRSARQNLASATVRMNVGAYDPLLGRSYYEIAAESRSQHKSQGFGVLQKKGAILDGVTREAARVGPTPATAERGLFDGVDTTWSAWRALTPPAVQPVLDSALQAIAAVRAQYRAQDPAPLVGRLADVVRMLRQVQAAIGAAPPMLLTSQPGAAATLGTRPRTMADPALWDAVLLTTTRAEQALVLAAGVALEATAPTPVIPVRDAAKDRVKDSLPVTITLFNRGTAPITLRHAYMRETPTAVGAPAASPVLLAADSAITVTRTAVAFEATAPWWRINGRREQDWFATPIDARDESRQQERTSTVAHALVEIAGIRVNVTAPVVYRFADPVKGDQQLPIMAVPGITLGLEHAMEYIRAGVPVQREVRVRVQSAYDTATTVTIALTVPTGLTADSVRRVRVLPARGSLVVTFRLAGTLPAGRVLLRATATHDGVASTAGYVALSYEHITPQHVYGASGMYLSAVSVKLPPRARVGYIVGVGDHGVEALQQLDVPVEAIDPASLSAADLSRFTSIVVGPRAYEANEELVRRNARLLDYASRGGTLVVQYGAQDMSRYPVTPYPLEWTRPAARVTREDADVRVLQPSSPLLTQPNAIGAADWAGWVQERATYMPSTIDPRYSTPIAMHDPDEPDNRGGLLMAPVGRGRYVYVTLALFRQLPAGVPGAARLLLNVINGAGPAPSVLHQD
ncbi:MAG: PIG-L family deacetylase [Gemmatimonadaceae bacterium]